MEKKHERNHTECRGMILPVRDALDVINGKWKLPIIIALTFGVKRFSELSREIPGITDRMLSKELRDLELNQLVKRTVHDTFPVTVEYSLTEYGQSLENVIDSLRQWGVNHRKRIMGDKT
ncbi:winged helix-turn-helix transcriptional regulator [Fulvivirga ligni]|uniref:winged helix-turn-helix transcriptional regulator n=1 Tax=Fulvivirga ligni TaxID=2904246 RepID=UPI001F4522F4|nr:helix-turn-helix domain-containing protein [Fulvivirga ligni]UII21481.1 helix-turn-helix transcriptional regulator [Fulvivirga ligni]